MAINFNKLTISELNDYLLNVGCVPASIEHLQSKADYVEACENAEKSVEDTKVMEKEEDIFEIDQEEALHYTDIESGATNAVPDEEIASDVLTQDEIMSYFQEDELLDGYPTCAGLRRVSQMILGAIVKSGPTQVFPSMDPDGPGRATVVYEVVFEGGMYSPPCSFADVADAYIGNVPDAFYAKFPVAIASTRAEGRALRKAIGLNVVAADERSEYTADNNTEIDDSDTITSTQIAGIEAQCGKLKIDVEKFINKKYYTGESTTKTYNDIKEVPRKIAAQMLKKITAYTTDHEKSEDIPSEILR